MAIVSSPSLQLQTGLAGTLSESLHTAVVNEAATIVDDLSDALLEALLAMFSPTFLAASTLPP